MADEPIQLHVVTGKIVKFAEFLNPNVCKLVLSNPYQMRKVGNVERDWPKSYVQVWGGTVSVGGGVYLHFNDNDELLYVGVAASLGHRLARYYKGKDEIVHKELELSGGSRTRVVRFEEEIKYLAPALEWYLIESLDPPLNKQRRRAKSIANLASPQGGIAIE